ncbi:MAG: hypothetical protein MK160_02795 [Rhodobacteraceae bacterium]|nr:hypothetical protein [Paracoccaceae bacterium]
MKAIVHIGMHKTGTSSIQASFAKVPPSKTAYYTSNGTNLNQWARVMFEGIESFGTSRQQTHFADADFAELRQAESDKTDAFLSTCEQNAVILSAERFTYMSDDATAQFADWLNTRFSSVDVYAYVRDPLSFCRSSLQQRIKAISPDLSVHLDFPNYRKRFEKFETHFGSENINYRLFRRSGLKEENVVPDFADWIGSAYNMADIISENEGMSLESLAFLVLLNQGDRRGFQSMRQTPALSELVADVLSFPGSKWHYSEEMQSKIMTDIASDCDWMDSRLPLPLLRHEIASGQCVGGMEDLTAIGIESFETVRDHLLDRRFERDTPMTRRLALQSFNILKTDW